MTDIKWHPDESTLYFVCDTEIWNIFTNIFYALSTFLHSDPARPLGGMWD